MNDLGSDFSKSYLIYIEECLGTFYSKHPSGPHLPLCKGWRLSTETVWLKISIVKKNMEYNPTTVYCVTGHLNMLQQ